MLKSRVRWSQRTVHEKCTNHHIKFPYSIVVVRSSRMESTSDNTLTLQTSTQWYHIHYALLLLFRMSCVREPTMQEVFMHEKKEQSEKRTRISSQQKNGVEEDSEMYLILTAVPGTFRSIRLCECECARKVYELTEMEMARRKNALGCGYLRTKM